MNIHDKNAKTILTPAGGYLSGYSHSLNPYMGCPFACSYCYVRQLPVSLFREEPWGSWIEIKRNAATLLPGEIRKARKKGPVTLFMSSATDPYQPLEYKERITQALIQAMLEEPPDFLFVQTRSPLVVRDLPFFRQFGERIRVSMTIETDLENIRKHFTPKAPPLRARLRALRTLTEAGIPTQATIAPMLPFSRKFPSILKEVTQRVALDDFFMGDGARGKRTERLGIRKLFHEIHQERWFDPEAWKKVYPLLKEAFPEITLLVSKKGFKPGGKTVLH
ncbi:SPL family radical SAM protein [Thermicanus aegyptius]|uniref:SPL family radical SAM protein n=1 Tax=Thermicanus aegyptius TaxID=94009 RepID=UPI00040F6378|nr:radical SAM protein [Thermicanus aegyptius]